ncbi:MAG: MFS transporter [Acidobacteriota bacterium]|nr:MFS transporter [Acidobacteriota bacterium]
MTPGGEAVEKKKVERADMVRMLAAEKKSKYPPAVRALRNRNFRMFWSGNFLSNIGSWMENVARGWLVLLLTNSAFWLGFIGFAGNIPFLFFTLFGGVYADRVDKRRLLLVTQTVMMVLAFTLAALAFFKGHDGKPLIRVWEVALIAFLNGVTMSMNAPSYQAMVPKLVEREDLTNAIALNSAQFNMSRILGPTLGGYAMAIFGVAGNFFLNGLSFLAVIFALTKIRYPELERTTSESVWTSLRAGFRYLNNDKQMRVLMCMTAVVSFLGIPFIMFIPYFAKVQLQTNASGLGWLMACSGLGAVLGAMTVAVKGVIRRRGKVLTVCGIVFFCAIIGICYSYHFALSAGLALVEGYNGILMISCFNVSMQHLSSDEMRGRMMSIYATSFLGLPPLGSLLAGELSRHADTGHVLAGMAGVAILSFVGFYAGSPALRGLD